MSSSATLQPAEGWGEASAALMHTNTHAPTHTFAHAFTAWKMRLNRNERPEGLWQLLNKPKSQWFFSKSLRKAKFCQCDCQRDEYDVPLWKVRVRCCLICLHASYIRLPWKDSIGDNAPILTSSVFNCVICLSYIWEGSTWYLSKWLQLVYS